MGWTIEGSEFDCREIQEFSFLQVVQIGSGSHPASYPMGTEGFFPWGKAAGDEACRSPPTCAKVTKMWIYISNPAYTFMA
jgi:hypothetical protein